MVVREGVDGADSCGHDPRHGLHGYVVRRSCWLRFWLGAS